jgi:activator of HSP90 ATPase
MPKTITQSVEFENTTPQTLYELYMNAGKHAIATAAPAEITENEGDKFSLHGGYITGKNLQLVRNKLIVQSWRPQGWGDEDVDSTLIIYLKQNNKGTTLYMTHVNVPEQHLESVTKGWNSHYWEPWKKYLEGNPIARPPEM